MASAPSHKLGQIIGNFIETLMVFPLLDIAKRHGLYLDFMNNIRPARKSKKISWVDIKNNSHDLDYVLEIGGTDKKIGTPVAFIECAWRRHTKHSRNKAQEIQGALLPLAEAYSNYGPFLGVVLAGEFTKASITQLQSHDFAILHFPYDQLVEAFRMLNVNIAYKESDPDVALLERIPVVEKQLGGLSKAKKQKLLNFFNDDVNVFLDKLKARFERKLVRLIVLPLYGKEYSFSSIKTAIQFLKNEGEAHDTPLIRYEIQLFFSNHDEIKAVFFLKNDAVNFLNQYID